MDGRVTPLQFPVAAAPGPGETITIAPGVRWLRMPLPFALDHINLRLIEDGPGWTIVDAGYAMPDTMQLWEQIFAERLGELPVTRVIVTHYHPDHVGLAGRLTERWGAHLWITEKEWLYDSGDEPRRRGFHSIAPQLRASRRPRQGVERAVRG
jgi:glyoxylase-like metal-dependent hydrolase (beta-lactamase superfamily II)